MGSDSSDDAAAWERAASGEGLAYAELFRKHQGRVYRRALTLVGEVHGAEDIVAAAFFELWRKRRSVRVVEGSVLPWLLVTTVNLARNHRRATMRYRGLIASLPRHSSTDPEAVAVANLDTRVLGIRLSEAFSLLSSSDVALLVLTTLDGLTIADAADALGMKPGTARMRLKRARERLQENLADERHRFMHASVEGENG
jgi:RNA polymerase sigma factor (sigma-70 family)